MPLFTVIIPTYSHVATLPWAIRSVLDQELQDFELIVVGDGAPRETELLMSDWCSRDSRIQFQKNAKGAGNGELHRHDALQNAKGSLVAYLGDDDLWLPHHLQTLAELLLENDMAHTPPVLIEPNGKAQVHPGRLDTDYGRKALLEFSVHACGPTSVGHTMAAYRKLPFGWRTKPEDKNSDTHMWQQCLSQDWLSVAYSLQVSTLHMGSPLRKSMSDERRGEESRKWYEKSRKPGFVQGLMSEIPADWQARIHLGGVERELANCLLAGEPVSPEMLALYTSHIGGCTRDYNGFMLTKALRAQNHRQWEVAQQLYSLVQGDLTDTGHLLLQARYLVNSGDHRAANHVLDAIEDDNPDTMEKVQRVRKRLNRRKYLGRNWSIVRKFFPRSGF